jgi:hypothetical protein
MEAATQLLSRLHPRLRAAARSRGREGAATWRTVHRLCTEARAGVRRACSRFTEANSRRTTIINNRVVVVKWGATLQLDLDA